MMIPVVWRNKNKPPYTHFQVNVLRDAICLFVLPKIPECHYRMVYLCPEDEGNYIMVIEWNNDVSNLSKH